MAAPTSVRVYATGIGAATIKWAYGGASNVAVYRSTDGITYSSIATVSAATLEYDDTGLANKTKYYYKLSDDSGSTFSSVVTVVTYVATSGRQGNGSQFIATGDPATDLQILQDKLSAQQDQSDPCPICLVDGAIVVDCTSGCKWFQVIATADINSISLLGCDGCPDIDFIIPPNTTRGICGWPQGCNFPGDECFIAPIPGGTNGRTCLTNGMCYDGYGPSPRVQTQGCKCSTITRTLSIVCCSSDCTLSCA